MPDVIAAEPADQAKVAAALAAAFQEDPVMRFIFPEASVRTRRLPGVFALLFAEDIGARFTTPDRQAATLWQAPGTKMPTVLQTLATGWPWLQATGPAVLRALSFSSASDANRPAQPHWYLHIAGCAPASQGNGLGRVVIRAGLDLADRDHVPAYLETATERNLGYYQAMGFAVTHSWQVAGRLKCWSMLRPAT